MRAWWIFGVMLVALFGSYARGAGCDVVNGGFDDDGYISDLAVKDPNGWTAVVPKPQFSAYVYNDWPTNGFYSLTMLSGLGRNFVAGDMVTVSQNVDLSGADSLGFDLKLETDLLTAWNPTVASAVVMIDGDVVWDSNGLGTDVRGEYRNRAYAVEDKYKTAGMHMLSLGLRINVTARVWESYVAYFDRITLSCYCNGGGLLAGDFNRDCVVDVNDLASLAAAYLQEADAGDAHNLWTGDDVAGDGGMVSLYDLAVLLGDWDGGFDVLALVAAAWLGEVEPADPANLFAGDDVQPTATINFMDFAPMADNWLQSSWLEEPTP